MFKIFITLSFLSFFNVFATEPLPPESDLKKEIGHMLVLGFNQTSLNNQSPIIQEIQKYNLAGVILFDRFYAQKDKVKNIDSPQQLQQLTQLLQHASTEPLLIGIDQEGGRVQRMKPAYGFANTPSAYEVATQGLEQASITYSKLAQTLKENGVNTNFAPVVDLAVNKDNVVIYQLKRAYRDKPEEVIDYARVFIEAHKKEGIIPVLKHFPGHGSSLGDSHKGFVDVTQTWSTKELEPYKKLIEEKRVSMIMTAHVFNQHLDESYPATLSRNINTKLLREELHYNGVIISDDLQMDAIKKHYSLKQTVTLAINSGVDLLLFGNQLAYNDTEELVNTIYEEVLNNHISYKRIQEANRHINALLSSLK